MTALYRYPGAVQPPLCGFASGDKETVTNYIRQSEDLELAGLNEWNSRSQMLAYGSGSIANATVAPNGHSLANLEVPNTTNSNAHYTRQNLVGVFADYSAQPITFSAFVKDGGYDMVSLRILSSDVGIVDYDLTAKTTDDDTIAGIDDATTWFPNAPSGWLRIWLQGTLSAVPWLYIYPGGNPSFAGDGTSGVYVWGTQVEAGLITPGGYAKTTTQSLGGLTKVLGANVLYGYPGAVQPIKTPTATLSTA